MARKIKRKGLHLRSLDHRTQRANFVGDMLFPPSVYLMPARATGKRVNALGLLSGYKANWDAGGAVNGVKK